MKSKNILFLIILAAVCVSLCGCQEEASSGRIRQAQLVGNENLLLKKQLREKDKQIDSLKKQLEQSKQEAASAKEKAAETEKSLTAKGIDYQQKLEQCERELNASPTPCTEVEAQYAALYSELANILSACQAQLDKYEQAEKK